MAKLSDTKIRWMCRHIVDLKDWDKNKVSQLYGVSVRRVEQVVRSYSLTGKVLKLKKIPFNLNFASSRNYVLLVKALNDR